MKKMAMMCAVGLAFGSACADPTWVGPSGNWSDAKNWADGILPLETDTVRVSNTVENITINLDSPEVKIKAIRFEGHSTTGIVTVTGGKLVLTSSESTMKSTGVSNTFYWEQSYAAIVAYPWGAEFQVPVEFTSKNTACVIATGSDIHFYKPVTAPNATVLQFHAGTQYDPLGLVPGGAINRNIYLHDSLTAPNANVTTRQTPCGNLYLLGPSFEADKLESLNYVGSTILLNTTNTVLHSAIVSPKYTSSIRSDVVGGIPENAVFHFRNDSGSVSDDNRACINLGLTDRTIDRVTSEVLATTKATGYTIRSIGDNTVDVSYYGSAPTTLTLRGTDNAVTECKVCDDVTVVWDPVGDYTQTFTNRTHTTKGSFIVKRGTMKLNGAGSIAAARSLEIAAGATFELDSTIADALPRDIIVTSTSKLKLNGATVNVKRLVVDGVAQADGTYTGTSWLDGEGSVVVAAGNCYSWIGGSGNWSDTTHWLNGAVPSSTSDIVVLDAQSDEDITITMDKDIAVANFPGVLEIINRGEGTTTLNIASSVVSNDGFMRVGRNARVKVPENGSFFYETTVNRSTKGADQIVRSKVQYLSIVDGGVWETCGGTTVYTNVCGQFWVNGAGSKLVVSGGMHLYSDWGSIYPLSIGAGARLELTGGTLYQPHEGYNQNGDLRLFGGTADFSGGIYNADVACVGPGSGAGHAKGTDFGYGTFIQRGTSDVKFSTVIAMRPLFLGTHFNWIAKETPTFCGNDCLIGGRRYGDATLTVYDTPQYVRSQNDACGSFYLGAVYYNNVKGADAGYGKMYVKSGAFLRAGHGGIFVAGGNASSQTTALLYQKGYLKVEPNAAVYVQGSTHQGYYGSAHPLGIGVGVAALTGITSGRLCEGLAEVSGYVTNRISLTVGGWHGKGVYVQDGGETLTGWQNTALEHGATAIGFAGGDGSLLVSNGVFTSQQSVWVGGCRTNDFVVQTNGGKLYPNEFVTRGGWPAEDKRDSEGLLEVSGGDFATTKDLYVGSDGTGVVSVVGSTGSFKVGQNMVFSNNLESVARFTADADGVKPIEIDGKLVLTHKSTLEVDLSACPNRRKTTLFTFADGVEGDFGTVNIVPSNLKLIKADGKFYVSKQSGLSMFVR